MDPAECLYCPTISLRYRDKQSRPSPEVAAQLKSQLFHDQCDRCELANVEQNLELCCTCKHLRIYHIYSCFSQAAWIGIVDGFWGDNYQQRSTRCDYCSFLETHSKLGVRDNTPSGMFMAFPTNDSTDSTWAPRNIGHWAAMRTIHVNREVTRHQSDSGIAWNSSVSGLIDRINWSLLRKWLRHDLGGKKDGHISCQSARRQLVNVRVVDVNNRRVIQLPQGAKYVALSYVWGSQGGLDQFELTRSNAVELEMDCSLEKVTLPGTIKDAVEVCHMLGVEYLWVDRLCIIQDDTKEQKAPQLSQMGLIYGQASFTIVAAAGEDAHHGLPGVSKPRRSTQCTLAFTDIVLCHAPEHDDLLFLVHKSKWCTRGCK